MSTTLELQAVTSASKQRPRPVLWWCALGAAAVLIQFYVYGSWILSPDFRPVDPGPDPMPGVEKMWAVILQVGFTTVTVLVIGWVVRNCVRQRSLTFDAKLMLAWWSMLWLDPAQFFLRPVNLYNSHYFNRGSWVPHIPGWISPNMANLPNPWFVEGATYAMMIGGTVATCALLRLVKRRRPETSNLALFGLACALYMVADFLLEEFVMIRTGWLSWSGTARSLSLFGGTRYQFPVAEALFFSAVCAGMAALRFWRDDRGRAIVERGVERISSRRLAGVASTLAIVGFAQALIIAYNLIMIGFTLYVDPIPSGYPSYMLNGICGHGTPYQCPGPGVPIYMPHK